MQRRAYALAIDTPEIGRSVCEAELGLLGREAIGAAGCCRRAKAAFMGQCTGTRGKALPQTTAIFRFETYLPKTSRPSLTCLNARQGGRRDERICLLISRLVL